MHMHPSIYRIIWATLALIILAQVAFAPVLLSVVFVCALLFMWWQASRVLQAQKVSTVVKLLFMFCTLVVIYLHYRTFLGVDAGVAFLTACLFAKSLETRTHRDAIVLFNFALFVSASLFLYSQAFWMAVLIVLALIGCFLGLYRLQITQFEHEISHRSIFKHDLKQVLKVLALSTPFLVLLFMFFPRLPPLWHIPLPEKKATTGMSDRMSPGDIAALSQSAELAFRILGNVQQLPARTELYWRGMALDHYDGKTWTSSVWSQKAQQKNVQPHAQKWNYQYLAMDQSVPWIMGLEYSIPTERRFYVRQDGGVMPYRMQKRNQPIPMQWVGKNALIPVEDVRQTQFLQQINTQFNATSDPRAQALAQQLYQQSGGRPELYIRNIFEWYKKNSFVYTLSPGTLGENRIDDFLFASRQGFCEHYASSFALLMRYVGIPARVVVGYQGGALAPDGETWEVRQLDAHAWTEVQLNGEWQRFDPTGIIAPERIDQGMQDLMQNQRDLLGDGQSTWQYQQFQMLKTLRVWSDYASYQWQSKVVGYDVDKQKDWFAKLGLSSSYSAILVMVFGITGLILFFVIFKVWQAYRALSELDKILRSFTKKLSLEQQKGQSETFQQWMIRLSMASQQDEPFVQATKIYQNIIFKPHFQPEDMQKLEKLLKQCANNLKS